MKLCGQRARVFGSKINISALDSVLDSTGLQVLLDPAQGCPRMVPSDSSLW